MDFRPVLYIVGILLCTLAISMAVPMLADIYVSHPDWKVFFLSILVTGFFGGLLVLTNSGHNMTLNIKQGFVMITAVWVTLSFFSSIPLYFSDLGLSFADAVFEAVSGITTTGSTVITGLDSAPRGILLWRGILQWLGGIGVILMAISVMPFLKVGGMQLFKTELSENEKALPRTAKLAASIGLIYVTLTIMCMFFYHMAGMSVFDALAHALTTISTGGFSTYDTSFGHYREPWIEIVAITFMIAGGLPFVLYLKAINGNIMPLLTDTQVRWFLSILGIAIATLVTYMFLQYNTAFTDALLPVTFNIISIMTGTGYTNADFGAWGGFAVSIFFFLMVVGACAGSTTCGIKIFRFQVLYEVSNVQIKKLLHPHGVFIPHYNNKPLADDVPTAVMGFFFLYALSFSLVAIALSFTGLDFITAMSGAATSISNVGPGLGSIIGPSGTFQPLSDSSKWILTFSMLLGRLELFPIFVLLSPHLWRR